MRVRTIVIAAVVCCAVFVGNSVVFASSPPTPEINRANATMNLKGTLGLVSCVGEDGITYHTYRAGGPWQGTQTEVAPDPADYGLTGTGNASLTFTNIVWEIKMSPSNPGVFTATVTLRKTAAGAVVYTGSLTLLTQGLPVSGPTPNVYARGWLQAHFAPADDTIAPPGDDYLLANVQFKLNTTIAQGNFGSAAPNLGVASYAVVTNVAPTAADGVC